MTHKNPKNFPLPDVSPIFTIYPAYHPNRPRFYNTASLLLYTIFYIDIGIHRYINSKFNLTNYTTGLELTDQIAYENYIEWLKTHEDLQIAANYLTNPQLYWVARAHIVYAKFQGILQKSYSPAEQLMQKYLHIYFKLFPGFQEAFRCKFDGNDWRQFFDGEKDFKDIDKEMNGYSNLNEQQRIVIQRIKVSFWMIVENLSKE